MKKYLSSILLGLTFLYACSSNYIGNEIPFERLIDSNHLGITNHDSYDKESLSVFVTSSQQEQDILNEIISDEIEKTMPKIDYNNDILISVFRGVKSGGGYETSIKRITVVDNNLYIYTYLDSPQRGELQEGGIRSPFSIVRISKSHFLHSKTLSLHLIDDTSKEEIYTSSYTLVPIR